MDAYDIDDLTTVICIMAMQRMLQRTKKGSRYPTFSDTVKRFFLHQGYCGILYLRRLFPRSSLQLTKHGLEWPWLAKQVHQMGRDTTCLSPATGQIMPTPNQVKEQALPLDCTSIATVGSKENKTGPRVWYSMIQPCGNLLQVIQVLGTKTAKTLSPRLLSPAVVARNLRQKPAPCILSCGSMDRSSHRQTLQTLQESRSEDNIHQGLHTIVQVHPVLKVLDIQAAGWQADFGYAFFSILIRHVSSDPYPMIWHHLTGGLFRAMLAY